MYLKEVANPAMSMGNFLPPLPPTKPEILFVVGSSIGEEIPKGLKNRKWKFNEKQYYHTASVSSICANLINPTGNIAIVFNFLNSSKRSRE